MCCRVTKPKLERIDILEKRCLDIYVTIPKRKKVPVTKRDRLSKNSTAGGRQSERQREITLYQKRHKSVDGIKVNSAVIYAREHHLYKRKFKS